MIVPDPNPILGATIHSFGGVSASTCYVPYTRVKQWTWETYWLVFSVFAWLITPFIVGFITVPDLIEVLRESPANVKWNAFLLGAVYGFGGMSFGFAIKHIGYSLTYTISIGISAVLGTIVPLMLNGTLIEQFQKPGGMILLAGMLVAILGVAGCGWAGFKKEHDLTKNSGSEEKIVFNMNRGLALTIFAGVLSAVFGISLAMGQPIADIAASHGAGHFEGNSKIILSTTGCVVTNLIWFVVLGIRRGTLRELKFNNGLPVRKTLMNYLLAILSGVLWYMQFFFYGLATVRMGVFMWASWVIHMSMLIFFSFIVGMVLREWRKVSKLTYTILVVALIVLISSFVIMTWGSVKAEKSGTAIVEQSSP
ncbi:MAG: L-rhamnose/proton symporter RhaT [Bacteroidota bacterium]|nr:L-rhamnose/proton symporter RhaT [Bacteroidota bacterium]